MSPRMRATKSLPAYAGKPLAVASLPTLPPVDPRVRGNQPRGHPHVDVSG
jgi:hypothetical protein